MVYEDLEAPREMNLRALTGQHTDQIANLLKVLDDALVRIRELERIVGCERAEARK